MSHAGFFQSTTNKSNIVGGTASATGLTDDNGCLVQVIFSWKQGIHDLSDYDQRRITGIIIYIFQSHVDCLFVVIRKYFNLISCCTECRLKKFKVNRWHLWAEDGISLPHFFCKRYFFNRRRTDRSLFLLFLTYTDRSKERADTDSCSSQVIDFINFQCCINLIWIGQDLSNLICRYGIQTTAEGI